MSGDFSGLDGVLKDSKELINIPISIRIDNNTTYYLRLLKTVLHTQKFSENLYSLLEALLRNGADPNLFRVDEKFKEFTPLYLITAREDFQTKDKIGLVDLFIKYGADINLQKHKYINKGSTELNLIFSYQSQ